jgi:hypothetical protein
MESGVARRPCRDSLCGGRAMRVCGKARSHSAHTSACALSQGAAFKEASSTETCYRGDLWGELKGI